MDPDRFPLGALWLQDHFSEDTFAGDPSAGDPSAGGLLPRIFPKIPG
ncbi:MAG: hypothetical protein J6A23_09920 [Thermoguttaceae bacterium]|nr:hypothetical protein [Thermoguttaceae bacterium]MBP3694257.1 hypothetical protein [Thermoguttaceae bacterium]